MGSGWVHLRNLAANWVGQAANLLVMFLLSPFIVHSIGKTEYGIWSLLNVLTGYMGLLDLGVRASTGRFIILYLGRDDHPAVDETIRTGLGFFSAAGLLILLASIAIGAGFPVFFPTSPREYDGLVVVLLPLMGVNLWLSGLAAVYGSVLAAHDRFDMTRGVGLAVVAFRGGGSVLALKLGHGLAGLAVIMVLSEIIALVGNYRLARRVYPRLRSWPFAFHRTRLKELFKYGIAAFISRTAFKLIGQTSVVVVGICVGVAAVTSFSVGTMLVLYSWTFLGNIGTTFFPPVQRAAAKGDLESVRWYYLRQVRMAFIFGVPVYVGFILFGESFIRHWMLGPKFPEASVQEAAAVMSILSFARLIYVHAIGAELLVAAMGRINYTAGVSILEAIANLGLSVLFAMSFHWGTVGVAVGALAARILVPLVAIPWMSVHLAKLRPARFLGVMGRGALAAVAFAAMCLLARWLIPDRSWASFALQVAFCLAGYMPLAMLLLVPEGDRRRVLHALRLAPSGSQR